MITLIVQFRVETETQKEKRWKKYCNCLFAGYSSLLSIAKDVISFFVKMT